MLEIETREALTRHLATGGTLSDVVLQGLDLREDEALLEAHAWRGAVLLGCRLPPGATAALSTAGALVFPELPDLPFEPYRPQLYTVEELYDGYDPARPESYRGCLDARVYQHWQATGGGSPSDLVVTLARRLHDLSMTDARDEFLAPAEGPARKVVALMGGHSLARDVDGPYAVATRLSRDLAARGFTLASGGGPGAMEAAHVGPWFVGRPEAELDRGLAHLATAASYKHPRWLATAFEVRRDYPLAAEILRAHPSLGIPTWLYGHEPPNAFATHVAKYFENAIREDGLLTIADHGIVFSPGSAGTIQEVFQDACQNHYVTAGVVSPMVFLGREYWTETKPIYPVLETLAQGKDYARWLRITDDPAEVVAILEEYAAWRAEQALAPADS